MKSISKLLPELYLLSATLYYWSLTALVFNPVAIILIAVLLFQLVKQKPILGLVIASVILLINSYLVLALISEFRDVNEASADASNLILIGSLFIGLNLIAGSFLLYQNLKRCVKTPQVLG